MRKIFLTTIFLLIVFASRGLSQGVLFGVTAGTTTVAGPSAYMGPISSGGAGFTGSNFHIGGIMKIFVPVYPLTPVVSFNYHKLKGNSNGTETSQNIYSIGLSAQFTLSKQIVSPYLSVDGSYNYFGKFEFTSSGSASSNSTYTASNSPSSPNTLSSKARFGGGLGVGADFNIIPHADLDLSIRYQIMNLLGAKTSEESISFFTVNMAVLF